MRILFAGTPAAAVPTLNALHDAGHEIVGVIAQPDRPKGRGRQQVPGPVAQFAADAGFALHQPERVNDAADVIAAMRPEIAVIVAYGALIRPSLLEIPRLGWLNLHFSLLPAYRGAAPVQHALLHGEEVTGATTFLLDQGMDTGPIVGQVTERVRPDDTTGTLLDRLAHSGAELTTASVAGLGRGEIKAVAQPPDGVSYAPKITRDQARIDWRLSARLIERHVRAMTPTPGAFTHWADSPVIIERVSLTSEQTTLDDRLLEPGEVSVAGARVLCGTGSQAIEILSVRPSGKRSMGAAEWMRGLRESVHFS